MSLPDSLQAIDLVNGVFLARGDTAIIEQECYQGSINRLTRLGVNTIGIPLDRDGMRMDACRMRSTTSSAAACAPKYIYTIPTVQNPTGTHHAGSAPRRAAEALGGPRRAGVRGRLLCRSDLGRQSAARDLRHEPARRRRAHRLVLEVDRAGAARRLHRRRLGHPFARAVDQDRCRLRRARADGARGILRAAFCHTRDRSLARAAREARHADGSAQRAVRHRGRIRGAQGRHLPLGEAARQCRHDEALPAALKAGVAINPGPEWSVDKAYSKSRMRLCFASPTSTRSAKASPSLAEVCRSEFGVPTRSANVTRATVDAPERACVRRRCRRPFRLRSFQRPA